MYISKASSKDLNAYGSNKKRSWGIQLGESYWPSDDCPADRKYFKWRQPKKSWRPNGAASVVRLHTYIHTYIHTYMHTYIHTYIYTYIRTYIHTYIYTNTRKRTSCNGRGCRNQCSQTRQQRQIVALNVVIADVSKRVWWYEFPLAFSFIEYRNLSWN